MLGQKIPQRFPYFYINFVNKYCKRRSINTDFRVIFNSTFKKQTGSETEISETYVILIGLMLMSLYVLCYDLLGHKCTDLNYTGVSDMALNVPCIRVQYLDLFNRVIRSKIGQKRRIRAGNIFTKDSQNSRGDR